MQDLFQSLSIHAMKDNTKTCFDKLISLLGHHAVWKTYKPHEQQYNPHEQNITLMNQKITLLNYNLTLMNQDLYKL